MVAAFPVERGRGEVRSLPFRSISGPDPTAQGDPKRRQCACAQKRGSGSRPGGYGRAPRLPSRERSSAASATAKDRDTAPLGRKWGAAPLSVTVAGNWPLRDRPRRRTGSGSQRGGTLWPSTGFSRFGRRLPRRGTPIRPTASPTRLSRRRSAIRPTTGRSAIRIAKDPDCPTCGALIKTY